MSRHHALSLGQLAILNEIAAQGSITKAARNLGRSKAALSRALTQMEEILGVSLLARTTRKIALSPAGEETLAHVQAILAHGEDLAQIAQEAQSQPKGLVRMAAPLAFVQARLAEELPAFFKKYPEIRLEMAISDATIDLVGGGFDLALRVGQMPDSSLKARYLAPVDMVMVAAPAYWNRMGRPSHPSDLVGHACLVYANASDRNAWTLRRGDEQVRVPVSGPLIADNAAVELPVLRAGLACVILPDFVVAEDLANGTLEALKWDWELPPRHLHILFSPSSGRPKRVQALVDFLVALLAQKPALK